MESVIGERGLFYMCNLEFKADESIEQVIDKYADMVYRLALAKTQNKYDAEDVFQTVFMKYLKQEVYRLNVHMLSDVLAQLVVLITIHVRTMVRAVSTLLTIMEISIRMICVEM